MPDNNTSTTAPVLPDVPAPSPTSDPVASDDTTAASAPAPDAPAPVEPSPEPKPSVSPVEEPVPPSAAPADPDPEAAASVYKEVADKISESHNVLIALSSDPSVDEMAAAIGLSLYLDKLGKRATAIYSGSTPNALEFLKPEETFEDSADTLQDFVIALNKDKADHLRYKLDGDFVKIYITPYKTRIAKDDLDFSYGDYNVDLVLALDVANGIDLDSALREHGRIMHDAVIVNITTGKPGKFGEIEWSDKAASSVSQMIARLLYSVRSDVKIDKEEATAFLTGIVAATNRFSNKSTTPETMKVASKLMESGANQQLVAKNITPDIENELFSLSNDKPSDADNDPTHLEIKHGDDEDESDQKDEKEVDESIDSDKASEENNKSDNSSDSSQEDNSLMDDLKAAAASLSQTGAETTPVTDHNTLKIDSENGTSSVNDEESESAPANSPAPDTPPTPTTEPAPSASSYISAAPEPAPTDAPTPEVAPSDPSAESSLMGKPEKVIEPSAELSSDLLNGDVSGNNKYGQMLEEALNSVNNTPVPEMAPAEVASPAETVDPTNMANPATMNTPTVPNAPEINGVPEMNYTSLTGEEILPPPPAPPVDMSNVNLPDQSLPETAAPVTAPAAPAAPTAPIMPATPPAPEPEPTSLGPQPAMQDQVYAPQAADPGAFKIPGM